MPAGTAPRTRTSREADSEFPTKRGWAGSVDSPLQASSAPVAVSRTCRVNVVPGPEPRRRPPPPVLSTQRRRPLPHAPASAASSTSAALSRVGSATAAHVAPWCTRAITASRPPLAK